MEEDGVFKADELGADVGEGEGGGGVPRFEGGIHGGGGEGFEWEVGWESRLRMCTILAFGVQRQTVRGNGVRQ